MKKGTSRPEIGQLGATDSVRRAYLREGAEGPAWSSFPQSGGLFGVGWQGLLPVRLSGAVEVLEGEGGGGYEGSSRPRNCLVDTGASRRCKSHCRDHTA